MSIRSLTTAATADPTIAPTSYSDALISAIPTEPLAAYTALLGVVSALADKASYVQFRWAAYAVFLAVIVVSVVLSLRTKSNTNELLRYVTVLSPAVLAGGVWGLAMPGSALSVQLSGDTLTVAVAALTIGGSVLIAFFAKPLVTTPPTAPPTRTAPPTPTALPGKERIDE